MSDPSDKSVSEPSAAVPTAVDRAAEWLLLVIKERHQPGSLLARAWRFLGRFLTVTSVAYAVGLAVLLGLMDRVGEHSWLLSFFLFFPGQFWLLPLAILTPLCLLCRWRLILLHLVCVVGVLVFFMRPAWGSPRPAKGQVVRVMTNNIGENNKQSLKPFAEAQKPDIIALQEATMRGRLYAREFPGYQMAERGQFVLLSKYPIIKHDWVAVYGDKYGAVAAWFELDVNGRPLVVYNVHLVTPRTELYQLRGPGFVYALAGVVKTNGYAAVVHDKQEKTWLKRVETAGKLAEVLRQEQRPFIVLGDFNMPNRGHIYRTFASFLTDCFAEVGRGYGLTFPGYTSNPLSLFGPWLRLDYVFAGQGVRPVECVTEKHRRSQHRSVAAALEMAPPPALNVQK